jgi:hypothetical protein
MTIPFDTCVFNIFRQETQAYMAAFLPEMSKQVGNAAIV